MARLRAMPTPRLRMPMLRPAMAKRRSPRSHRHRPGHASRAMTIPGKIGPRLRQLRQARGFTLRETATAAGIHFTYLSKIENDHEPVGEDTLRALADILSADVEELLALAGKIPVQLQQRAVTDSQFALFLRRLPHLPRSTLTELYEL